MTTTKTYHPCAYASQSHIGPQHGPVLEHEISRFEDRARKRRAKAWKRDRETKALEAHLAADEARRRDPNILRVEVKFRPGEDMTFYAYRGEQEVGRLCDDYCEHEVYLRIDGVGEWASPSYLEAKALALKACMASGHAANSEVLRALQKAADLT